MRETKCEIKKLGRKKRKWSGVLFRSQRKLKSFNRQKLREEADKEDKEESEEKIFVISFAFKQDKRKAKAESSNNPRLNGEITSAVMDILITHYF